MYFFKSSASSISVYSNGEKRKEKRREGEMIREMEGREGKGRRREIKKLRKEVNKEERERYKEDE